MLGSAPMEPRPPFRAALALASALLLVAACDKTPAEPGSGATSKAQPSAQPSASSAAVPAAVTTPPPAPEPIRPAAIPAPEDVAAPPADAKKTASGLAMKVLTQGKGKDHPGPDDTVKVHYTGWTTDGKMFDSSVARGEPASFRVSGVIKGWTEGLQLMT